MAWTIGRRGARWELPSSLCAHDDAGISIPMLEHSRVFTWQTRSDQDACHRAKNVGSSTSVRFMDIGVNAEANRADFLPLLTVQNRNSGEIKKTTELGRALNTRLWADIGKVRVLGLRGLASRAPYFHSGQAKDIKHVLNFYKDRFDVALNGGQRADLEAFLLAL
jgi:cytochrome c peroxidase